MAPMIDIPSQMRVKNDIPYALDEVLIRVGTSENNDGPLLPNDTSAYMRFYEIDHPYIRVTIAEQSFEFQIAPTDDNPPTKMTQERPAP